MSEAVAPVDFDTWLARETQSERRHEYVGGRVYLMAGGTERHDLAAGLLYETLAPTARARGCRPFAGNRIVRTPSGSSYYPDEMVAGGQAPHRLYETEPVVLIEILSPSTAGTDRREKATAYAAIHTLELLLLVDPDAPRAEAARLLGGRIVGHLRPRRHHPHPIRRHRRRSPPRSTRPHRHHLNPAPTARLQPARK